MPVKGKAGRAKQLDLPEEEKGLGDWLYYQHKKNLLGELSQERHDRLVEIGVVFRTEDAQTARDRQWTKQYEALVEYRRKHGHIKMPQNKKGSYDSLCEFGAIEPLRVLLIILKLKTPPLCLVYSRLGPNTKRPSQKGQSRGRSDTKATSRRLRLCRRVGPRMERAIPGISGVQKEAWRGPVSASV